jgi:hypothetical protein
MKTNRLSTGDQQRSAWRRARHVRRHWAMRPGQAAGAPTLSLGTLQALMGLAAYQARTG